MEYVDDGLLRAYVLAPDGSGRAVVWDEVRGWRAEDGMLWVHVDFEHAGAAAWVREEASLDELAADVLLTQATRPRAQKLDQGEIVVLRGVNLDPSEDPEDMVAVRMWVERDRIVSSGRRKLMAIDDIAGKIDRGRGPGSSGEFVAELVERLLDRMEPVLEHLDDRVDSLEERAAVEAPVELAGELAEARREVIGLRRHLAPQREALARLAADAVGPFGTEVSAWLRELSERLMRMVESLDEARDRAGVVQDQISGRQAAAVERRMEVLAVVTGVFLPLGLITGLLGINVGGMPGVESGAAFWWVCGLLVAMTAVEVWILRRMKWF